LNLKTICSDINWGDAKELIKTEGFYVFGGRNYSLEISNELLIIEVKKNKINN